MVRRPIFRAIPLSAAAAFVSLVLVGGVAQAAQQCRGTRITRQCDQTHYENLCPIDDFQCRFFKQSTNTIVCYSFQVPCGYDETTLEGRFGLLGYPLVKTESLPLGTPY